MKKILNNRGLWLLLLGMFLIAYLITKFGFSNIFSILQQTEWETLIISLLGCFLILIVRGFKWYLYIFEPQSSFREKVSLCGKMISYYLINNMVSSITPFRSGELYGPFLMKKKSNTTLGQGFFIILMDRILELAFLIIITFFSIFSLLSKNLLAENQKNTIFYILLALLGLIVILFTIIINKALTQRILQFLVEKNSQ